MLRGNPPIFLGGGVEPPSLKYALAPPPIRRKRPPHYEKAPQGEKNPLKSPI